MFIFSRCRSWSAAGLLLAAGAVQGVERVPLDGVAAIATYGASSCALMSDGGVACWGDNSDGQLGTAGTVSTTVARPVLGLAAPAVQVAVGYEFACARLQTGAVQCWGVNFAFQLGDFTVAPGVPQTVPGLPADVIGLTAGSGHACVWTSGGALYCWGQNVSGQLGLGSIGDEAQATAVPAMASGVTHVDAGSAHTCAVRNGRPWCWGDNFGKQLDGASGADDPTPREVTTIAGTVLQVAAGMDFSCALLANREVRCWGDNVFGQQGNGSTNAVQFQAVQGLGTLTEDIDLGILHGCARASDGALRCWGHNGANEVGDASYTRRTSAVLVPGLSNVGAFGLGHVSCAVDAGVAKCWGDPGSGRTGKGFRGMQAEPAEVLHGLGAVRSLDIGGCVLGENGAARCWGSNGYGQLVNGTTDATTAPVPMNAPAPFIDLARGLMTCGVTSGGAVYCGGGLPSFASFGSVRTATEMEAIAGLGQDMVAVAVGGNHGCALSSTGAVRCWGANYSGELGDNSNTFRSTPVLVHTLFTGVQEIAAAGDNTCARTANTLYCWGSNSGGQVGDGSNVEERTTPQPVALPAAPRQIAIGGGSSCARDAVGDVHCWGVNGSGQLGDASTDLRRSPVKVQGLTAPAVDIAVGDSHACALQNDGRLACWGSNHEGALGLPMTQGQSTTAITATLAPPDLVDIEASGSNTCAADVGDRVWCWGSDLAGQLGDGGSGYRDVGPVLQRNPDHVHAGGFEPLPGGRAEEF